MKMSWGSASLVLLSVLAAPVYGHGFDVWQIDDYETVRFGVGIGDDCPLEQEVFDELFKDELETNGLRVTEWDFVQAGLYVRIECFQTEDPQGYAFYSSVSWVWEQGEGFPAIELVDYYGHRSDEIGVGRTAYQMMKVGIQRYLEKAAPVVTEQ